MPSLPVMLPAAASPPLSLGMAAAVAGSAVTTASRTSAAAALGTAGCTSDRWLTRRLHTRKAAYVSPSCASSTPSRSNAMAAGRRPSCSNPLMPTSYTSSMRRATASLLPPLPPSAAAAAPAAAPSPPLASSTRAAAASACGRSDTRCGEPRLRSAARAHRSASYGSDSAAMAATAPATPASPCVRVREARYGANALCPSSSTRLQNASARLWSGSGRSPTNTTYSSTMRASRRVAGACSTNSSRRSANSRFWPYAASVMSRCNTSAVTSGGASSPMPPSAAAAASTSSNASAGWLVPMAASTAPRMSSAATRSTSPTASQPRSAATRACTPLTLSPLPYSPPPPLPDAAALHVATPLPATAAIVMLGQVAPVGTVTPIVAGVAAAAAAAAVAAAVVRPPCRAHGVAPTRRVTNVSMAASGCASRQLWW